MTTVSHETLNASIEGSSQERAAFVALLTEALAHGELRTLAQLSEYVAALAHPRRPGASVGDFELEVRQQVSLALKELLEAGTIVFVKSKDNPSRAGCGYRIKERPVT